MTPHTQDPPSSSSSPAEPDEPFVLLEFSSFEDFLQSCSSKISSQGLFLEVEPRERVSSPLTFELRIRAGFRLLRGQGEVIRVHDPLPTSGEPAGVTVRFSSLDEASKRLLPVVLSHYQKAGIPLLDLDAEVSGVEVEVTGHDSAGEEATEVGLDDLWEEFEVETGRPKSESSNEEGSESSAPEPLLVEAEQFASGGDLKESGEELEAASEPLDEVESGAETDEAVRKGEADLDEADAVTDEDRKSAEADPLDLAGVLPTAPGGAAASIDDLELPPDELTELAEMPSSSRQQIRELWLLLLMAFLGVLIGLVVYLSYQDGFEWPWSSGSDSGQPASTELLAAYLEEVPESREIIDTLDFENPAVLGQEDWKSKTADATTETVTVKKASRKAPSPRAGQKQVSAQKRPPTRASSEAVLTGVDRITWQESEDETVLTLWGDGPFDTDQLVVFRLDTGTPRQVVKILGVSRPFPKRILTVGTSHVSTVRAGLHTGAAGQELHIVADLEDPEVRMRRLEPEGSQLHVYFSRL
jgi:hypothetical protein